MKLKPAKIQEAEAWVEANGLYPQRCGAPVKLFCQAMNISYRTYIRWLDNAAFADALSRARDVFKQNTIVEVTNALVRAAKGVDCVKKRQELRPRIVKEYDPKTGKLVREYQDGEPIPVKTYSESYYYPPDVKAAIFVLTNMDPDNWKNKQDTTADLNMNMEGPPVIVFSTEPVEDSEK